MSSPYNTDDNDDMDLDVGSNAQIGTVDLDDDDEFDEDYFDDGDEEEDDDMFYEEGEEGEDDDDDDEDDDESGIQFEIAGHDDDEDEGEGGSMTIQELAALLNANGGRGSSANIISRLLAGAVSGVSTRSGAGAGGQNVTSRGVSQPNRKGGWWKPQKTPHPKGVELLRTGEFGGVEEWEWNWRNGKAKQEEKQREKEQGETYLTRCDARPVRNRRLPKGGGAQSNGIGVKKMSRATIPNTNGTVVAHYPSVPYVGQYAKEDYSIFFAATQYYTIHLYDVSAQRSYSQPRRVRRGSSMSKSPTSPLAINAVNTGSGSVNMPGAYAGTSGSMEVDPDEGDGDDWTDEEEPFPFGAGGTGGRRGLRDEDSSLKKIKTVQGEEGRWTITDCDSTRDGSRMIYSSITPYVHMLHTAEYDAEHTCLDFTGQRQRGFGYDGWGYDGFGIWSIRFSADGNEVVAGAGNGRILVYDIEAERRTLNIRGHADDVNAVCFADESSTNILVSGSDDGYVKIWDRRSLSGGTPSGVLVGATEGITYTSPKGDGRYIVVNSKDQAARLYDLRKMRQWSEFEDEKNAVGRWGQGRFDYRNSYYPTPKRLAHPLDCSVMTFRGHSVLRTLIRCHFSPRESTGQGYIYSGSADGMIHIWSLDGRVVQVLDRSMSIPLRQPNGQYSDPSAPEKTAPALASDVHQRARRRAMYGTLDYCTRDVSWHGYEPTLMSSSWEVEGGYRRDGSIAKHEWKGLGKGGLDRLEDWVEKEKQEWGIEEED